MECLHRLFIYISLQEELGIDVHHPLCQDCTHIPSEILLSFLNVVWVRRVNGLSV